MCQGSEAWGTQLLYVEDVRLEELSCYMLRMWGLRVSAVVYWGCQPWGTQLLYVEDVKLEGLSCYTLWMWDSTDSAAVSWGCEAQGTRLLYISHMTVSSHSHFYEENCLVWCDAIQCGQTIHHQGCTSSREKNRPRKNLQLEIIGWWRLGPEVNQWEQCKIKSDPVALKSITLLTGTCRCEPMAAISNGQENVILHKVLPWTPPTYKQAAPTYFVQFCPLYIFYTEEFPAILLYARDQYINPLKTKSRLLYLKTQFVPRSKHISSRLQKPIGLSCKLHKSLFVLR